MNLKLILASVGGLIVLLWLWFWQNEIKPTITHQQEATTYLMVGTNFEGSKIEKFDKIAKQNFAYIEQGILRGTPAIFYYHSPDTTEEAKIFAGVIIKPEEKSRYSQLPEGYEIRQFDLPQSLIATLQGNRYFYPSPQRVSRYIREWADERKLRLAPSYIDIYPEDQNTIITQHLLAN
jgi:hypothetical protein